VLVDGLGGGGWLSAGWGFVGGIGLLMPSREDIALYVVWLSEMDKDACAMQSNQKRGTNIQPSKAFINHRHYPQVVKALSPTSSIKSPLISLPT
jgi:hypothetical protein